MTEICGQLKLQVLRVSLLLSLTFDDHPNFVIPNKAGLGHDLPHQLPQPRHQSSGLIQVHSIATLCAIRDPIW